jgi:c-di-GMP-binding flagellar brake protein YcgR
MADSKGKLYIEKRKHRRISKQYDVRYKLMPKDMTIQNSKIDGKSRDISMGGIRIEGPLVGQEGDVIRLEMDKLEGGDHVVIFAEIRWIRKETSAEGQLGLQFLALREEDVEIIKQIIADSEQDK